MAAETINELPTVTDALLTDVIPAVQAGVTVQESLDQILSLFENSISSSGVFTPVLKFGGSSTGITYLIQSGHYYKILKMVNFYIKVQLTSKGTSTGLVSIENLPFTSGLNIDVYGSTVFEKITLAGTNQVFGFSAPSTNYINFISSVDSAYADYYTDANFTDISSIIISGSYLSV